MNVSWEKSGVQIFLLWHPLSLLLYSSSQNTYLVIFPPFSTLCSSKRDEEKSKKLSQNLFAQVTRQIASHIPNSYSTYCLKIDPKKSHFWQLCERSELRFIFWFQLFVYLNCMIVSCLFTFVISLSAVCLHLWCQFQLLVYKSKTFDLSCQKFNTSFGAKIEIFVIEIQMRLLG